MTSSVLEGHSPIASLFKCDISYFWCVARSLCICRASCLILGSSLTSQLNEMGECAVGCACLAVVM